MESIFVRIDMRRLKLRIFFFSFYVIVSLPVRAQLSADPAAGLQDSRPPSMRSESTSPLPDGWMAFAQVSTKLGLETTLGLEVFQKWTSKGLGIFKR